MTPEETLREQVKRLEAVLVLGIEAVELYFAGKGTRYWTVEQIRDSALEAFASKARRVLGEED